jgi:hypothetical protein
MIDEDFREQVFIIDISTDTGTLRNTYVEL